MYGTYLCTSRNKRANLYSNLLGIMQRRFNLIYKLEDVRRATSLFVFSRIFRETAGCTFGLH
jgi:hypothetical protein